MQGTWTGEGRDSLFWWVECLGGLGSPTLLVEEGKMLQGGQNPIWDQVLHPQALLDLGREEGEKKEERGEEGGGDRRWRERTLPPKAPLGLG